MTASIISLFFLIQCSGLLHEHTTMCLSVFLLVSVWVVSSSWLLWNSCHDHSCASPFVDMCTHFSWEWIAGSSGRQIFNLIRNCQIVFQGDYTMILPAFQMTEFLTKNNLHPHVLIPPLPGIVCSWTYRRLQAMESSKPQNPIPSLISYRHWVRYDVLIASGLSNSL